MGIQKRRKMTSGMSCTIETAKIVKLEDIAISRRAKFSPIVDEIIGLGIQKYDELEDERRFRKDLDDARELDRIKKASIGAGR